MSKSKAKYPKKQITVKVPEKNLEILEQRASIIGITEHDLINLLIACYVWADLPPQVAPNVVTPLIVTGKEGNNG